VANPEQASVTRELVLSKAGEKLSRHSGILELMDDLGQAMTVAPDMRMLGGGNPAAIPEFQMLVRDGMRHLLGKGGPFDRMLGNYEPPQGNPRFLSALASLLRRTFGWEIGPENIAVTSGAQTAFFYLFNLLGGTLGDGSRRKILLPLAPEYIGYADQGLEEEMFVTCRPQIQWPEGPERRIFKYAIDFDAVEEMLRHEPIGAIAASRPTNPTANVLTDEEVARLSALAAERGIPLILDNAYGTPFPGILFVSATPHWAPHVILTLSLSKLGLPGLRTGIVIGPEKIIAAIASLTAVTGLANGNVGQHLALPWIESGEILEFGPRFFRPFYEGKSRAAADYVREYLDAAGVDWALHASEGAFFHWLCLRGLRITSKQLYGRLKARKVITVPGEYFFYGLREDWPHRHECLRLNISQPDAVVREALEIIADEAAKNRLS
jgi:valine--pyruvate aminotransferase